MKTLGLSVPLIVLPGAAKPAHTLTDVTALHMTDDR